MDEKTLPLISIIVPVYNTEKYLEKCVKSIINQTYQNLQIILVDDGSKDSSSQICDRFEKEDMRIMTIHKENGGSSATRSVGVENAIGDYLMFVDSDDWIDEDTCERCVERVLKDYTDCVMFGYVREYERKSIQNPLFEEEFSCDQEEAKEKIHRRLIGMNTNELVHPEKVDNISSVCMKMYKVEVAKKGKFVDEKIVGTSEDTIFNIYALDGCSVSYVNKCFYHYRKNNVASITSKYKKDLAEKWDVLYQFFEEYLNEFGKKEEYYGYYLNRVACGMIGLGLNEISGQGKMSEKIIRIQNILDRPLYKQAFSQLDTAKSPIYWKFFFWLCKKQFAISLTILLMIINYLRSI